MSLHQVNNAFNLLGQVQEPAEAVRLPGPAQPTLQVAWGVFRQSAASNFAAIFSGPTYAREYVYKGFFKDGWIEGRVPRLALLIALLLHVALLVTPFPRSLTAIRRNPAFDNVELTWSGAVNDLPLLNLASSQSKPAARGHIAPARTTTPAPQGADAFHPRQRIFTDAAQLTHPRQTLISSAAPAEAPKILPNLPNVVQLQQAAGPSRPRLQIDEKSLAKLRPRERRVATAIAPAAPPSDVPVFQQQAADVTMQVSPSGPERPKLALNAGAAPRVAPRAQTGDISAAPEIASSSPAGGNPTTLIALSAAPAPPTPNIPVPQGNLSARVAISPEGKQPGMPGGSAPSAVAANAGSPGNSSTAEKSGAGAGSSPVSVSISGGNPVPKNGLSGPGGAAGAPGKALTKLSLTSPHNMLVRSATHAEAEEPQPLTGPPNFAALPPGAKPEQIFLSKKIYTLYVNMPNLNSTTGSWVLNFSEMRPDGGLSHVTPAKLGAPVPTKKVDPKYPPTLASDHVEGEIVLYAVIRRDGSVDSIQLVHGLDEQLDANSMSALGQWTFRPATREDQPVELEAIVHIPFHAAPKE
jgi:TonB family protein